MRAYKIQMPAPDTKSTPKSNHRRFYGYVVVFASFWIMVALWAAFYAFGVFFNPLINEFGWTRAAASGAYSLSSIVMGLLAIAMGKLTDRFGSRLVMRICALFLCLGYLLMSRVGSLVQLYLFYGVILGIGMGGSFVPLMSTVARWFVAKRNTMTGIVTAGVSIGALMGPPVVNLLIVNYGWRMTYVILGIAVSAVVLLASQLIKRAPADIGQLVYGEEETRALHARVPAINALSFKEAFRTGQFWFVYLKFFCLGFCTFAVIVHIAPHSINLGASAATAANILATVGGLSVIGRVVLGRAADFLGNKKTFMIGFGLMAAALSALIPAKAVGMLYFLAGAFGLAYGTCVASQSPLVAELFGLSSHGVILGFLSFGFTTGGALGPWVAGHLFDLTGSYQHAFGICAVVSLAGLSLSMMLRPLRVDKSYLLPD